MYECIRFSIQHSSIHCPCFDPPSTHTKYIHTSTTRMSSTHALTIRVCIHPYNISIIRVNVVQNPPVHSTLTHSHSHPHVMYYDTFKITNKTTAKLCVSEWGAPHRKSKIMCGTSALLCLAISATCGYRAY